MKQALLFCLLFVGTFALAQPYPPEGYSGKPLREWLRENWYEPYHRTLGYNGATGARGLMYNFIDNDDNTITCVYSGFSVSVSFGGTETNPQPINAEHTVPQSFYRPPGEDDSREPMRSDIFHLYPTYGDWNSVRLNYPFDEIDDNQTSLWMYLDNSQSSIPVSDIDLYSEYTGTGGNRFEPREDHKGNVARSIFYFYTMYEDNAFVTRGIDQVADIEVLLDWHESDEVDSRESRRNGLIQFYQGNQNPYIAFPELVELAWFTEDNLPDVITANLEETVFYINQTAIRLSFSPESYRVLSSSGQVLETGSMEEDGNLTFSGAPGLYIIQFFDGEQSISKRMLITF